VFHTLCSRLCSHLCSQVRFASTKTVTPSKAKGEAADDEVDGAAAAAAEGGAEAELPAVRERQHSVPILQTDAAVVGREVMISPALQMPPPSPAPAKDVARP